MQLFCVSSFSALLQGVRDMATRPFYKERNESCSNEEWLVEWVWAVGRTRPPKSDSGVIFFGSKAPSLQSAAEVLAVCKIQAEIFPELSLLTNQGKIMN